MDLGLIALICLVALLGPALSLLTHGAIPAVVGELLAGVLLGKTALGIIDPEKADLALLYSLGFATLMFAVGMQVPLHDERLRPALRRGATAVVIAVPLALAAGFATHLVGGGPALVYAVVLVSSSAAVALPIIEEAGLQGAPILTAMAWIAIADVLATLAIPLTIAPSRTGRAALGVLIVAALVVLVFAAANRLRQLDAVQSMRREGKRRQWAIDLRFAIVVLVGLAFVAQEVGASILVAGFGTGLVVGAIGGPKRLSREVLGLGQGFLIPLFFVLLGAKLNLRELGSDHAALLAVLLAAGTVVVHVLVSVAIRTPRGVGLLASAQMGVPAAVIALGLPDHTLNQGQASAIFCAALVTIVASAAGSAILRRGAPSTVPAGTAA